MLCKLLSVKVLGCFGVMGSRFAKTILDLPLDLPAETRRKAVTCLICQLVRKNREGELFMAISVCLKPYHPHKSLLYLSW